MASQFFDGEAFSGEDVFPPGETIRAALALAIRAPSVHNTQPWRWWVGPDTIRLYVQRSLHLVHADPDGRDLMVSCGAALHHAVVAFAALGWRATVHRMPDPAQPDLLATIELHPGAPDQSDIALAAAIPRRRTDRRLFGGWPVAAGDIAQMGSRAARLGIGMRRADPSPELKSILRQSVSSHARDIDYLTELTVWSGRYAAVAGVPARSAPVPDYRAAIPGRIFAGPALSQPVGSAADDDDAVLLVLGTATDKPIDRLRSGEATSAVLLTATVQGLSTCPVTEPLEIAECRAKLREDVFGDDLYPQMLIRLGWAPVNADPLPATPRRELDDVVTWDAPTSSH